jgi:hypothetical protein
LKLIITANQPSLPSISRNFLRLYLAAAMSNFQLSTRLKQVSKLAYIGDVPSDIRKKVGEAYFALKEFELSPAEGASPSCVALKLPNAAFNAVRPCPYLDSQ